MHLFRSIAAAAMLVLCGSSFAGSASAITITAGGGSISPIGNSADSLTLLSAVDNVVPNGANFNLQAGTFRVGNSPINKTYSFMLPETITIGTESETVDLIGQLVVSSIDHITFFSGPTTIFTSKSLVFTPVGVTVNGTGAAGETVRFELQATLVPVPEPSSLLILISAVTVLIGLGFFGGRGRTAEFP